MKALIITVIGIAVLICSPTKSQELSVSSSSRISDLFSTNLLYEEFSKSNPNIIVRVDEAERNFSRVISAMASGGDLFDIVELDGRGIRLACAEGLLSRLELADIYLDPSDLFIGDASDCGVPIAFTSEVVAFDRDQFNELGLEEPTLNSFFDPTGTPGKRGIRRSPQGLLELALVADGVAADEVYEVLGTEDGVERALDVVGRIENDIVFWRDFSEAPRLLREQAVIMSYGFDGHFARAIAEGKNLGIVWGSTVLFGAYWGIPSNSENVDLATAFLNFAASPNNLQSLQRNGPVLLPKPSLIGSDLQCSDGECPCAGNACAKDCCRTLSLSSAPDLIFNSDAFWRENKERIEIHFFERFGG